MLYGDEAGQTVMAQAYISVHLGFFVDGPSQNWQGCEKALTEGNAHLHKTDQIRLTVAQKSAERTS